MKDSVLLRKAADHLNKVGVGFFNSVNGDPYGGGSRLCAMQAIAYTLGMAPLYGWKQARVPRELMERVKADLQALNKYANGAVILTISPGFDSQDFVAAWNDIVMLDDMFAQANGIDNYYDSLRTRRVVEGMRAAADAAAIREADEAATAFIVKLEEPPTPIFIQEIDADQEGERIETEPMVREVSEEYVT